MKYKSRFSEATKDATLESELEDLAKSLMPDIKKIAHVFVVTPGYARDKFVEILDKMKTYK